MEAQISSYGPRPICDIARDIIRNWTKPYFGAVPYLKALRELNTVDDYYGLDSAETVVVYFLANAAGFRGQFARELKQELKNAIKRG